MTPPNGPTAHELLDFYLEAGADALLGEEPVDRFASDEAPLAVMKTAANVEQATQGESRQRSASASSQSLPRTAAPSVAAENKSIVPPDKAAMEAREAARSAKTLDELRAILEKFDGCALKATASRLVFADGNPESRVMFVGEAPGREEDIEGVPFVGRSGRLLDQMLKAIGLDRSTAYITNIVPWRPPGNRDPSPHESEICLPFIQRQIELVDPDFLICLGKPSMQTLLKVYQPITKARGRWFPYDTGQREIRAMPTFHPAFLLRSTLQKRFAWRDMLAIKKALAAA